MIRIRFEHQALNAFPETMPAQLRILVLTRTAIQGHERSGLPMLALSLPELAEGDVGQYVFMLCDHHETAMFTIFFWNVPEVKFKMVWLS